MPQDSKQAPKKSSQPSPSLLKRIFGDEEFSPEMQQGIDIAKKEVPNLAPVYPYGFFSRLTQPSAAAYVPNTGSSIYLNSRSNEGQTPQDIADTLIHEQTHIGQRSSYSPSVNLLRTLLGLNSTSEPYEKRPEEMAAFQAEKDRRSRMGRSQTAVPSFTSGNFYVPHDVYLPSNRR